MIDEAELKNRAVVFRCKAPESTGICDDVPDEYAVAKIDPTLPQGIIIYGKYHGVWHANPSCRGLVNVLMARVKELEGERNLMAKLAKCQDEPQFTNPLMAMFAKNLRDKILSEVTA